MLKGPRILVCTQNGICNSSLELRSLPVFQCTIPLESIAFCIIKFKSNNWENNSQVLCNLNTKLQFGFKVLEITELVYITLTTAEEKKKNHQIQAQLQETEACLPSLLEL